MKKTEIDPEDWITLAEAARLRNTSRQAISNLVKRKRLETLKIGGHIFVNKSAVRSFLEAPPGRKAKKRNS